MDLLNSLPNMPLEQMLQVAQQNGIPTHSTTSRVILFSDIARWIETNYPGVIQRSATTILRLDTQLQPDQMVTELGHEVGINLARLDQDIGFAEIWLHSVGISYLTRPENIKSAIVYYLYEHKETVPREWWYRKGDQFSTIYEMSLPNFREYFDTFSDDTYEEWLLTNVQSRNTIEVLLEYQPIEALSKLSQQLPPRPHFETKVGFIFFIASNVSTNPQLKGQIIQTLQSFWGNAYVNRTALVTQAFANGQVKSPTTYNPKELTKDILLAMPPTRIEEFLLTRGYPQLEEQLQVRTDVIVWKMFVDPGRKVSLQDLEQIVGNNSKSLRNFSDVTIVEITQMKFSYHRGVQITNEWDPVQDADWSSIQTKIRNSLRTTFRVEEEPECNNMGQTDVYGETIVPGRPYATFGPGLPGQKKCYSFSELAGAFFDQSENRFIYRRPDNPNYVFSSGDILNLLLELKKYKIRCHLTQSQVDPDATALEQLLSKDEANLKAAINYSEVSPSDKQKMLQLLVKLFEAGMYQRRWCGRTTPYVMTGTGTLPMEEIAAQMTVVLNEATDLFNSLSTSGQEFFKKLPVMREGGTQTSRNLYNEFQSVREGNQCTALAQGDFILSSDFYIRILGSTIPGFDVGQFVAQATHYQGNLPVASGQQAGIMTQEEIRAAHAPPTRMLRMLGMPGMEGLPDIEGFDEGFE